ncbi:MAG: hypothetical protein JWP40_3436 [Blastococcus sp.]|jgi:hypothetical protein|nr:hypothetical protein [Blastococcus sp.]
MAAHDPVARILTAQIAAHTRWAMEPDRTAATAPGRRAADLRFERMVDEDGTLDPVERAIRAQNARTAHYKRMAALSKASRARKREALNADSAD